jgi:hypothetical protein
MASPAYSICDPSSDDFYSRLQILLDALINSSPPTTRDTSPRIVYVRDLGFFGSSAAILHSMVMTAVYNRISGRSSSQLSTTNSMAVVFGMSPPLSGSQLQITRPLQWGFSTESPGPWDESSDAQTLRRERRRERYKRWEQGSLLDDLQHLMPGPENPLDKSTPLGQTSRTYPHALVIASPNQNLEHERECREKRRGELNELQVRIAIGAAGGRLQAGSLPSSDNSNDFTAKWRSDLIPLATYQSAVDRAVRLATVPSYASEPKSYMRIAVSWDDLRLAWQEQSLSDQELSALINSVVVPEEGIPESNQVSAESIMEPSYYVVGTTADSECSSSRTQTWLSSPPPRHGASSLINSLFHGGKIKIRRNLKLGHHGRSKDSISSELKKLDIQPEEDALKLETTRRKVDQGPETVNQLSNLSIYEKKMLGCVVDTGMF